MADMHEGIVSIIVLSYQVILYIRSIDPMKREAVLVVIHNIFMYYIINCFKHLAQGSINHSGPVNTFYYVPLVYEAPALLRSTDELHTVLKSTSWSFLETLFRHHLALLLPFILAMLVPRCKMFCVSSLVIMSNITMWVCFVHGMWKWLILSGYAMSLQLSFIFMVGPALQLLLISRFAASMVVSLTVTSRHMVK